MNYCPNYEGYTWNYVATKQTSKMSNKKDGGRIATSCICCGSASIKPSPTVLMPFISHRVFGWEPIKIDSSWGLQTIDEGQCYCICKTLSCDECNTLFLDIRFSESELSNLYRDYRGREYTELRNLYQPGYKCRNKELIKKVGICGGYREFFESAYLSPDDYTRLGWGPRRKHSFSREV